MTHRDWFPIILAGIVAALIVAYIGGCYLSEHWHDLRDILARAEADEEALRREAIIRQALNDEAEYLIAEDQALRVANSQPCDHEDGWCTGECQQPRGKHHAPPLRYGPEPIIGGCITDLPELSDPRWSA